MLKLKNIYYLAGSLGCLLFAVILIQCNTDKKVPLEELTPEEASEYTWRSDWDSIIQDMVFARGDKMDSIELTPENLVLLLNKQDPYDVSFIKISGDTLFAAINNDQRLGEQMGSAGAHEYLGVVTLTLSEVEQISIVYLDFSEGSHAVPGAYTREQFLPAPTYQPVIDPLPL